MPDYKSSVLTCNVEEKCCPVCEFLNGDHSVENMLKVTEVLDRKLFVTEEEVGGLSESLFSVIKDSNSQNPL